MAEYNVVIVSWMKRVFGALTLSVILCTSWFYYKYEETRTITADQIPLDIWLETGENITFSYQVTNEKIETFSANLPKFLPHYRNPCWYENLTHVNDIYSSNVYFLKRQKKLSAARNLNYMKQYYKDAFHQGHRVRVRCLPYFYIIGVSKCGTTDLFSSLNKHPLVENHISMKEPKYWDRYRHGRDWPVSLSDYIDFFDRAAVGISKQPQQLSKHRSYYPVVFGDGTPAYSYSALYWGSDAGNLGLSEPRYLAADYIKHFTQDAKLIVILRQPTARLYSDYLYFRSTVSKEAFHKRAVASVNTVNECLRNHTARECVYSPQHRKKLSLRINVSLYYIFLKDWLTVFPRNQFYFTRLEDYARQKSEIISQITQFLGIGALPGKIASKMDKPSRITNSNKETATKVGNMLPETEHLLNDFFQPWNEKLANLLEDDRFLWKS